MKKHNDISLLALKMEEQTEPRNAGGLKKLAEAKTLVPYSFLKKATLLTP